MAEGKGKPPKWLEAWDTRFGWVDLIKLAFDPKITDAELRRKMQEYARRLDQQPPMPGLNRKERRKLAKGARPLEE